MSENKKEMLKYEIEVAEPGRTFKRYKSYVLGAFKLVEKKNVQKGADK